MYLKSSDIDSYDTMFSEIKPIMQFDTMVNTKSPKDIIIENLNDSSLKLHLLFIHDLKLF